MYFNYMRVVYNVTRVEHTLAIEWKQVIEAYATVFNFEL